MSDLRKTLISDRNVECEKEAAYEEVGVIDIDFLIHDVLIIKAESLKDKKIFGYADYLEKQLMKIKRKEAILEL